MTKKPKITAAVLAFVIALSGATPARADIGGDISSMLTAILHIDKIITGLIIAAINHYMKTDEGTKEQESNAQIQMEQDQANRQVDDQLAAEEAKARATEQQIWAAEGYTTQALQSSHVPSFKECLHATSQMLKDKVRAINSKIANDIKTFDINSVRNGTFANGLNYSQMIERDATDVQQSAHAQNTLLQSAAAGGQLSTAGLLSYAKAHPAEVIAATQNAADLGAVAQLCGALPNGQGVPCYNNALQHIVQRAMRAHVGGKAVLTQNTATLPGMPAYISQRSEWENNRSDAIATITKILPKLLKSDQYYSQAFGAYLLADSGGNQSAGQNQALVTTSATKLDSQFPGAGAITGYDPNGNPIPQIQSGGGGFTPVSGIGMSEYELQEAEFYALTAGGQTLVSVQEKDADREKSAQLLQAYAAQIQIANVEQEEYNKAMQILANDPPQAPQAAIQVK